MRNGLFFAGLLALSVTGPAAAEAGPVDFARAEIASAQGRSPPVAVTFALESSLGPQSYVIKKAGAAIAVTGGDAVGAMFGGLDVAEALRLGPEAVDALLADPRIHTPYIGNRGIKFNIPLDLRTPSYSDGSDAARANIPEMWSREFWAAFLDEMARHRYNVLSLWSLHPFPSMVRVPEYPDVALDDVWRSRAPLGPAVLNTNGINNVPPAFLADHEVVKKMTIDEKISFWRGVMQLAADRGIAVYLFTWNVFTYGAEGKYGITPDMSNRTTVAYFRASVREMVKTYPLLAGIGITAGEHMDPKNPDFTREEWLWATYGEGVRDALAEMPGRKFPLIHRYHSTVGEEILPVWKQYPGFPATFTFSYKYSVAHMYSLVNPPFIKEVLPDLKDGLKTWLTVRNDDIYSFRWGDPDFARDYVLNMPGADKLAGFYMGPDGFNWGRDFLDRELAGQSLGAARPLVMQKQWYAFMLWGRLAFDPGLSDAHFQQVLAARFPGVNAGGLYATLAAASKIIPQATRCFWGDIDIRWFPEACVHNAGGTSFYTVADFMRGITMPGAGLLTIREWRQHLLTRQPLRALSPLDAADALAGSAHAALAGVAALRLDPVAQTNRELRLTLGDCEAMAQLGLYYAEKIRGACDLALYDAGSQPAQLANARAHLSRALAAWQRYAAVRDAQYVPAFYNRIGQIDITALTTEVAKDLEIARNWKPGTLENPAAGGDRGTSSLRP